MRFVAGRGAVATEMLLAGAPWWKAIGMMLLVGAPWWKAIGKMLLAGAPWWQCCCWPGDATERDAAGRGAVVAKLLLAWGRH